jgi:hypothetical protein
VTKQRQERGPPNGESAVETGKRPSGRFSSSPTTRPAPRSTNDLLPAKFVSPFAVSTRHPAFAPSVWSPAFMRSGGLHPSVFRHPLCGPLPPMHFSRQTAPFGAIFAICLCYFSFSAFQHFSISAFQHFRLSLPKSITILSQFHTSFCVLSFPFSQFCQYSNPPLLQHSIPHITPRNGADSDESGHLFQSISDTIPGLSDSCRSEATL